jgi:hypothetical protein
MLEGYQQRSYKTCVRTKTLSFVLFIFYDTLASTYSGFPFQKKKNLNLKQARNVSQQSAKHLIIQKNATPKQ